MRSQAPWKPILRRALRGAEHILATLGALFLIYHLCFSASVVVSGSMSPTLQGTSLENGDRVLIDKLTFHLRKPRRWEVVALYTEDQLLVMKRVVGLPGETVSMKDNSILVDGKSVRRPESLKNIKYIACGKLAAGRAVDCTNGYFVLGDDSRDSFDSRFEGPVKPLQIVGRAWLVVWPLSRIGFVNPRKRRHTT